MGRLTVPAAYHLQCLVKYGPGYRAESTSSKARWAFPLPYPTNTHWGPSTLVGDTIGPRHETSHSSSQPDLSYPSLGKSDHSELHIAEMGTRMRSMDRVEAHRRPFAPVLLVMKTLAAEGWDLRSLPSVRSPLPHQDARLSSFLGPNPLFRDRLAPRQSHLPSRSSCSARCRTPSWPSRPMRVDTADLDCLDPSSSTHR